MSNELSNYFAKPDKAVRGVKYITAALQKLFAEYNVLVYGPMFEKFSSIVHCAQLGSVLDGLWELFARGYKFDDLSDTQRECAKAYGLTTLQALGQELGTLLLDMCGEAGLSKLPPFKEPASIWELWFYITKGPLLKKFHEKALNVVSVAKDYNVKPESPEYKYLLTLADAFCNELTHEDKTLIGTLGDTKEWGLKARLIGRL